ncbi:MAG: hypothetical protein ACM3KR_05925 [Deltaproteobacteria bacterium]
MGPKTKKIIIIVLAIFIILQAAYFIFYFSYNKHETGKTVSQNTPSVPQPAANPDNQVQTQNNSGDSSLPDDKITVITKGQLQMTQRNLSSLESTLASRIPLNDRVLKFVSGTDFEEIDASRIEKVMVDNLTYEFKLSAQKGNFIEPTSTSYLLQLQIPAQGNIKSTFKWFLFDTNLQLVNKLNLKQKGIDLPCKFADIKDYDNDGKQEILIETTKYLNPDNYSSPRYLFKATNEKQLILIWREEAIYGDRDTGKCSSVTRTAFDQGNPPPPNNPELLSIKKIYTSALSSAVSSDPNNGNPYQNNTIPMIANNVTYQEIREYPDRQEIYQKVLDVYTYTWDVDKNEFVYTKKESRNLDVNLD